MSIEWCLMRMVSKSPGQQDHHSLAYIRDLQVGEKTQIDQAMNMLRSFASSQWEWNKVDLAYNNLLKAIDAAIDSKVKANGHFSENERAILSRTAIETAEAIVSWPNAVLSGTSEHLGADEEGRQQISELAAKLVAEDSILNLLKKIVDAHDDSLVDLASSSGSHIAYMQKRSLETAGVPAPDNWIVAEIFSVSLSQLERLAALTLTSYRKSIEDAARIIQGIYGETLYGLPVLIPKENLTKLGTGVDLQVSPVEKPDVEGLLRAADAAAEVLTRNDNGRRVNPRVAPAKPATSGSAAGQGDQTDGENEYAPLTSNLRALLVYASSLTTEAEIAWSEALDSKRSDIHREILTRWFSFITSLKNHLEKQTRQLDGNETTIARFPVSAEYFAAEMESSNLQKSLSDADIAEVYAVRNLVESLKGLQQPTLSSVDLATGQERTWWDSGAFHETRKSAEAALRITQRKEYLATLAQASESADAHIESPGRHGLLFGTLGQECLRQGHYEASIVYFSISVRQLVNQAETQAQSVDDAVEHVIRLRGAELENPARLLLTAAEDLACGKSAQLEKIVVLANFWAAEIGRLVRAVFESSQSQMGAQPEGG